MHYIKNYSTYKSLKKAVDKVRTFLESGSVENKYIVSLTNEKGHRVYSFEDRDAWYPVTLGDNKTIAYVFISGDSCIVSDCKTEQEYIADCKKIGKTLVKILNNI